MPSISVNFSLDGDQSASCAQNLKQKEARFNTPPRSHVGHSTTPRAQRTISPYRRAVAAVDGTAIGLTLAISLVARLSLTGELSRISIQTLAFITVMACLWLLSLYFLGSYDPRFLGYGTEEYRRVASSTFMAFGLMASASFILKFDISRAFVLVSLPLGLVFLLIGRRAARVVLHRKRQRGEMLAKTLVIGTGAQVARLGQSLGFSRRSGFRVVACKAPPGPGYHDRVEWLSDVAEVITSQQIEVSVVAQSDLLDAGLMRDLVWSLEGHKVEVLVDPGITDVAAPRLSFRGAYDVALVHLDVPQFTGPKRLLKRSLDILIAGFAVVAISPLLLFLFVLVKSSSPGPGLFIQARVGQNGKPFRMIKFRTMQPGAEKLQDAVWGADNTSNNKCKNDPRVTSVGSWMRRWSLDELPQFFNVLGGSMSIVGPRPIQQGEAKTLVHWQDRRHLTKPGLTGLWQISGRSDTTWNERMKLDIEYIERWSPTLDLVVVLKTIRVVLVGQGAY